MLVIVCEALLALFLVHGTGCATQSGTESGASPMPTQTMGDSGIYGHMTVALGNAPANSPSTQCIKVYDSAGARLIATGTCTGMLRDFRVPLAPGRYVVEFGGSWESKNGAVAFVPDRRNLDIGPGQWIKLAAPPPRGPVP
jgi:hypothetical protein